MPSRRTRPCCSLERPTTAATGDAEYRYRPDSDLYWLTGWPDPEAVLFLRPGEDPVTLFVQPKDREREIWTGYRPGPEGARADYGIDVAHEISALPKELPALLTGVKRLHHAFAVDADNDALLMGSIAKASRKARKTGEAVPDVFVSPRATLHELRLHKTADEIAVMAPRGRDHQPGPRRGDAGCQSRDARVRDREPHRPQLPARRRQRRRLQLDRSRWRERDGAPLHHQPRRAP